MCAGDPGEEEGGRRWPPWLHPLLQEIFFRQCKLHAHSHKSECNMYCLDCVNGPLCSLCVAFHSGHRCIQIRRSSYHDVIRVSEIQKVLDISGVQTYVINSARVVFLNERPQPRPGRGVAYSCKVCSRSLPDSHSFCSLACKIVGISSGLQRRIPPPLTVAVPSPSYSEGSYVSNPSTPPAIPSNFRSAKRRKGIPRRAPLGPGIIIGY